MSRIGIKPVILPAGVEVKVDDNNVVTVKGPKGELQEQVSKLLKIEVNGTEVIVSRSRLFFCVINLEEETASIRSLSSACSKFLAPQKYLLGLL